MRLPTRIKNSLPKMIQQDYIRQEIKSDCNGRSTKLKVVNKDEQQYLNLISKILTEGKDRSDRTGVGTRSIFGSHMRFNLRNQFPLLTTKKVFWRAVAEELLWFVKGQTDSKILKEKNIKIWEGNSTREFLDKCGLTDREEGDLGPVYGFQWRYFGAEYKTCHDDYMGQGVDQLKNVINTIKNNPTDRRICMSSWNPVDIPKMALPPCHCFVQFFVEDNELSCSLYQRAGDIGLGVPFNIASYALLTYMIAHVCGLKTGDFVHNIGDTHIYKNHLDPLKEQVGRVPRPFPSLIFNRKVENIEDFTFEDFSIVGYNPYPPIKLEMAV
ncbi:TYMS.2 family protein [Megaselia abdita]